VSASSDDDRRKEHDDCTRSYVEAQAVHSLEVLLVQRLAQHLLPHERWQLKRQRELDAQCHSKQNADELQHGQVQRGVRRWVENDLVSDTAQHRDLTLSKRAMTREDTYRFNPTPFVVFGQGMNSGTAPLIKSWHASVNVSRKAPPTSMLPSPTFTYHMTHTRWLNAHGNEWRAHINHGTDQVHRPRLALGGSQAAEHRVACATAAQSLVIQRCRKRSHEPLTRTQTARTR
jgi:hypothetical protein